MEQAFKCGVSSFHKRLWQNKAGMSRVMGLRALAVTLRATKANQSLAGDSSVDLGKYVAMVMVQHQSQ